MSQFRSKLRGGRRFRRLLKAMPDAVRGELVAALELGGRFLQAAMRQRAPRLSGALNAAIQFKVLGKTLRLRVGFLKRFRGRFNGRRRTAVDLAPFYGRIQDLGRVAQTVNVTRHLKVARRIGNNRKGNTRRTIYASPQDAVRLRPKRSPNAGTPVGSAYKIRVPAMAPKRFVTGRFPELRAAIARNLKGIWTRALGKVSGGAGE